MCSDLVGPHCVILVTAMPDSGWLLDCFRITNRPSPEEIRLDSVRGDDSEMGICR